MNAKTSKQSACGNLAVSPKTYVSEDYKHDLSVVKSKNSINESHLSRLSLKILSVCDSQLILHIVEMSRA